MVYFLQPPHTIGSSASKNGEECNVYPKRSTMLPWLQSCGTGFTCCGAGTGRMICLRDKLSRTPARLDCMCFARVMELADMQDSKSCDRKVVWVQLPPRAPEWNLAVENQPRSGRAIGTPTLFRLFSPMNSDSRLRRDGGFFRQEAGAKSEAILTHSICLIQKEFLSL